MKQENTLLKDSIIIRQLYKMIIQNKYTTREKGDFDKELFHISNKNKYNIFCMENNIINSS